MTDIEHPEEERVRIRAESGSVVSESPLVHFLYKLMNDHLTAGQVESIMVWIDNFGCDPVGYDNGWLANHAKDIAKRLTKDEEPADG